MRTLRYPRRYVATFPALFDEFFKNVNTDMGKNNFPAVNIKETDASFMIEMAAPGLSKDDFDINLEKDLLTISTVTKDDKEEVKENYTRREFNFSSFSRSFNLPADTIDMDSVKADYLNGVLTLTLGKKEEAIEPAPKKIMIG